MKDVENSVLGILNDYLSWEELKEKMEYENCPRNEKDDIRLENDNDAKYYFEEIGLSREEALNADTIISFWTPYTRLLELVAGWKAYKNVKSLNSLLFQINTNKETDYSSLIKKVNAKMEPFAQVYYTKGNFMLLPKRQMNNKRYIITEDRIDVTLYECFEGGKLTEFFNCNEELIAWICTQKLENVFTNNTIRKDKVKWFHKEDDMKRISKMTIDEIDEYLKNAIGLIENRNN